MEIVSLRRAAARLIGKKLLQPGDSLSCRLTDQALAASLRIGADGGVGADHQLLQPDAAAPLNSHEGIYGRRPDVGAVVFSQQPWATALIKAPRAMPGLFDEQVRHLGSTIAKLDVSTLATGNNGFLLDDAVLCLGVTLERAVYNVELLEKCATAYLLATTTGTRPTCVPWVIRLIAGRRLRRDERYAADCHRQGRIPVFKSAY
ncbi:class II aldolase/adducin family protein [Telmatospirillum sp.]|uniref:class II aldolase/adducin family protein n=1 Tax=Telmatospirillum sp. TaxID=2079197 RepID=UPI0028413B24|nr:class II aldolase/adducin family protein [Telmatospirillum sp.]MDR3438743.1 hypothetical protein [Telmatospirillum sp.]